jgi:hypothetical protein
LPQASDCRHPRRLLKADIPRIWSVVEPRQYLLAEELTLFFSGMVETRAAAGSMHR